MQFVSRIALAAFAVTQLLPAQSTTTYVYADRDSYIANGSEANQNFGGGPALGIINYLSGGNRSDFFVHWDVAGSIPANAIITEAKVYLTASWIWGNGYLGMDMFAVESGWSEYGITWNNQPPANTPIKLNYWRNYWANSQAVNVLTGNASSYPSFLALVQQWLGNPGSNHGLCFRGRQVSSSSSVLTYGFNSREGTNSNTFRPKLRITYTTPVTNATIQGVVRIGGVPAANVPVEFVSSTFTYGPVVSNGIGSFYMGQVPAGSQGYVRATVEGLGFYHTPTAIGSMSQPSDLNLLASGNLTAVDIDVPRPVVLVHGIHSGPSRWHDTETELHTDLRSRLASPGLDAHQARITFAVDYGNGTQSVAADAAIVRDQIHGPNAFSNGFRPHLATQYGAAMQAVPIDIVAHSKGGLVARAYIHNSAQVAHGDVVRLITLATPHGGSLLLLGLDPFALGPDRFDLHPFNAWGNIPNGFGATVTNLKGATLDVIGSIVPRLTLAPAIPGILASGATGSIPTSYWQSLLASWSFDDFVVSTWSSVAYPLLHAPPSVRAQVRNVRFVADTHVGIPSQGTVEDQILPWLY